MVSKSHLVSPLLPGKNSTSRDSKYSRRGEVAAIAVTSAQCANRLLISHMLIPAVNIIILSRGYTLCCAPEQMSICCNHAFSLENYYTKVERLKGLTH